MSRPSLPIAPEPTSLSARSALVSAGLSGVVLWAGTTLLTGRREAWDAAAYWTMAYPAGIVMSAVLGYLATDRAWRWGLVLMLAQAVALALLARDFSLLPLGLVLFGVLALPPMFAATVGARRRLSRDRSRGPSAGRPYS